MTRGRPPQKGLDDALPVAMVRGTVMIFVPSVKNPCDFVITGNGRCVFVRVRKAQCLRGTPGEMEREFHEPVTQLRTVPGSGPVSRELWTYSRYGNWRFFRVEDAGLVELCRDGMPVLGPGKDVAAPAGMASLGGTGAAHVQG